MINRKFKTLSTKLIAYLLSGCMIVSLAACGAPEKTIASDPATSQVVSSVANVPESSEEQTDPEIETPKEKIAISDFYEYANAEWFAESPLADDEVVATKTESIEAIVQDRLVEFLDTTDPSSYSEDDSLYKLITFYNQMGKDENAAQNNMVAMKAIMDRFESAKTLNDFYNLMLDEEMFVLNPLFTTSYTESTRAEEVLTLNCDPYNEIYGLYLDEENEILSEQYTKCLVQLGYLEEQAASICKNAFAVNDKIRVFRYYGTRSDYYFCDSEYFAENPCSVPFLSIFEKHGYQYEKTLYHDGSLGFFATEEYIQFINELFVKENLQMIKDFCVIQTLNSFAAMGDDTLYLTWKTGMLRCLGLKEENVMTSEDYTDPQYRYLNTLLNLDSENLAAYYMDNYVSQETVQKTEEFLKEIQDTFCEILKEIDWLDTRVRERLSIKAKKLVIESGRYSQYNTLDNLTLGDNAVETALALMVDRNAYGRENFCDKENVNVYEFDLTSFNAEYLPDINTMVINDAFYAFDEVANDTSFEAWLGSLGTIVAHELGHAYDPYRIELDSTGVYEELLNEEQYGYYYQAINKLSSGLKGLKTKSGKYYTANWFWNETFADLLGLKVSLRILSKLDNPDYDTFFRYYAYSYAVQMTENAENFYLKNDTHLLSRERVNFTLGQFQEFYDTYDVDTFGGCYIFPDNRVDVFGIDE